MSEDKEKISAYLDDGLSPGELSAIEPVEDSSKFGVAARYQMMGEAMRGQPDDAAMLDVSKQVHEALQHESGHTATAPVKRPVKQAARPMFDFGAWFKPLGGLAVAASVALVTIVAVTQIDLPSDNNNLVAGNDSAVANAPEVIIPGNVSRPVAVAVKTTQPVNQQAVNLDAYLAEHAEFAAQDTIQGRMPYARAVSYESE